MPLSQAPPQPQACTRLPGEVSPWRPLFSAGCGGSPRLLGLLFQAGVTPGRPRDWGTGVLGTLRAWGWGHLGAPAAPTPGAETSVEPQDCRPLDGGGRVPAGGGPLRLPTSLTPLPRTPCSLRPLGPRAALSPALWTQVSGEAGGLAARMSPPCLTHGARVELPCPHSGHSRSARAATSSQEGCPPSVSCSRTLFKNKFMI